MGIRYYAYPVRESDLELARENPRDFLADDPLADAWGPADLKPRMLYLDKCWRELQELFGRDGLPALLLVGGQVTHTAYGWIPHIQVLSPDQVRLVARHLCTFGEADVFAARLRSRGGDGTVNDDPDELNYVVHYLDAARDFSTSLASEGLGLIYTIG
ncbi:MAG: hypothetical protein JWP85_40 [Rhodoglobus sp.]|nr:hypothetical protein [Rhodoglobus sp.]